MQRTAEPEHEFRHYCSKCQQYRPTSDFCKSKMTRCKRCIKDYMATHRSKQSMIHKNAIAISKRLRKQHGAPNWAKRYDPGTIEDILNRFDNHCQITGTTKGLTLIPLFCVQGTWDAWNTVVVSTKEKKHLEHLIAIGNDLRQLLGEQVVQKVQRAQQLATIAPAAPVA